MTRPPGAFARSLRFRDDDPVMVLWDEGDPLTSEVHWISSRVPLDAAFATSIDGENTPIFWTLLGEGGGEAAWNILEALAPIPFADFIEGPCFPRSPWACACVGHQMPGVSHIVACCDRPHVGE